MHYLVYTDGAYSSARDQGGVGIVVLKDGEEILRYNQGFKRTTNNRMELTAVILALSCVKSKIDELTIVTDSQYVIGCATKGWKRKANEDLWNTYDRVLKKTKSLCPKINFDWTKGHSDNNWNNLCDKLAVDASHGVI